MSDEMVGPQGWLGSVEGEHRAFGEMGDSMPEMVCRHDAKKVLNEELLDETMDIQQENGIDDGFSFLHFCEAIFGEQLKWLPQKIGSCVQSSSCRQVSYRCLAEVYLLNDPEELMGIDNEGTDCFVPFGPFNYRGGRRRAGLNGGDGSMCGPQIQSQIEDGFLQCDSGVQSDAYPEPQSMSLYRKWGNSNALHDQWKPEAAKIKQIESEEVKTFDDLKTLLTQHYKPMNICSNWGFAPSHKHRTWKMLDGSDVWIYKRQSQWAHSMSIVGCCEVDGDWYVQVQNSWGDAHKGRDYFWITESTAKSWLRSASCMTVGEIDLPDNLPIFRKNKD